MTTLIRTLSIPAVAALVGLLCLNAVHAAPTKREKSYHRSANSETGKERSPVRTAPRNSVDLRIAAVASRDPSYQRGELVVPMVVTVQNDGTAHAGAFRVGLERVIPGARPGSQGVSFLVNGQPAQLRGVRAKGVARVIGEVRIKDPKYSLAGRVIHVRAKADSINEVRESNETNNFSAYVKVTVPRRAAPQRVAKATPQRTSPPVRTNPPSRRDPGAGVPQRTNPTASGPKGSVPSGLAGTPEGQPGAGHDLPTGLGGVGEGTPGAGHDLPSGLATFSLLPVYAGDDGGAYYMTRDGNDIYFFGEHPGTENYACVFRGTISGRNVEGNWWDLPKGGRTGTGTLKFRIDQNGRRLTRLAASGEFSVGHWDAIDLGDFNLPGRRDPGFYSMSAGDLDGAWRSGNDSLYLREIGADVVGFRESGFAPGGQPVSAHVFFATRIAGGGSIQGKWIDVPKGTGSNSGFYTYTVADPFHLKRAGGSTWTRDVIDTNRFAQEIENRFGGNCVGLGYAISQDGQVVESGGVGNRMLAPDGGPLPFTADTQKGVQSTSKTITAAAILHLLQEKGLNLNSRIEPYLPAYWKRGNGVELLSMKDLLRHESGLTGQGSDADEYQNLKKAIEVGVADGFSFISPTFAYDNVNFALFRIIIPYLENPADMANFESHGIKGENLNKRCSERYVKYVRDHVLKPAGIA
ncbi:MAG: serine hydrolase, partial [Akkermansiaceae bacterium]|nr:serine hydrolase [Akkermansiaceae bacterium]